VTKERQTRHQRCIVLLQAIFIVLNVALVDPCVRTVLILAAWENRS